MNVYALSRGVICAVAALMLGSAARAEPPLAQSRQLQREAMTSYSAGDFEAAAKGFERALALRPHHPGLTYNLAAASAKAGHAAEAIAALRDYAAMGLTADIDRDADFAALKSDPAFAPVLARLKANAAPAGAVASSITVNATAFLAEGLAFDAASQRFLVTSVDQRRVVWVAGDGAVSDFVAPRGEGLLGALGVAIDGGRVWIATSGLAHAEGLSAAQRDTAGVFSYSLADGRLIHRALLAQSGETHAIGDLTPAGDGVAFATDSVAPAIYRVEGGAISAWMRSEEFGSLQGIALTPDRKRMVVADYARGLHVIDVATKAIRTIGYGGGTTLLGIDGIYLRGNTLVAVQNGVKPQRVMALTLNADFSAVEAARVMSANDPAVSEPALGAIVGDDFYVIANAQWSRFRDDGTRDAPLDPVRIAKIALPK